MTRLLPILSLVLALATAAGLAVACSSSGDKKESPQPAARVEATTTPTLVPTATPEPPTATAVPPTETPVPPTPVPPPPPPAAPQQPPPSGPPQPQNPPAQAPPAATGITVRAINSEYMPATITVQSGARVNLTLVNDDLGEEHDWEVNNVGMTATCVGPCRVSTSFVAPAPGTYRFFCIVHLEMGGTLLVR